MRNPIYGIIGVVLGLWILPFSNSAMGQYPGTPSTESVNSLGMFSIVINPAFAPAFGSVPGYNATTNIYTSPLLNDTATKIDLSASTTVGSAAYNSGLTVGSPANGTVSASSITALPPGYTPPAGEDTVFTKINTFTLSGSGVSVTAGSAAQAINPSTPASVGEVVSNATGSNIGNPSYDFPARSFFDVFVDIEVPNPIGPGNITMANPSNSPLIVENNGITSLPPVVIYTHGNSSAVPLEIVGGPYNGDTLGLLTLAGHGAGYQNNSNPTGNPIDENDSEQANIPDFDNSYDQLLDTPSDLMPLPNVIDPTSDTNEETWSDYVPDVPEPSSLSLLAVGVVAAGLRNRGRRKLLDIQGA
ncbi:MAG: PEP-CTERM sorting domain-containing protein [Tepidisphaeraceae bacterium]|jgi:hypothetical protein